MFKKLLSVILTLVMAVTFTISSAVSSFAYTVDDIDKKIQETAQLMYNMIPEPQLGSIGGEWTVMCLARSGVKVPQKYYDDYYKGLSAEVGKKPTGVLHPVKYTENDRIILALKAMGKDVQQVGADLPGATKGVDILYPLSDMKSIPKQGINGPIWALIALDTGNYDMPIRKDSKEQATREKIIEEILKKEIYKGTDKAGGWALTGDKPDPDITFMAIQALAKYKDQVDESILSGQSELNRVSNETRKLVNEAIERGLSVMSKQQLDTGGYASWGSENSESVDQAIVALCALGIDLDTDERFIKTDENGNKNTLIDALLTFYQKGGGFAHINGGYDGGSGSGTGLNAMATDQGMYALIAYRNFKKGYNYIYDMSDWNEFYKPTTEEQADVTKYKDVTITFADRKGDTLVQHALQPNYQKLSYDPMKDSTLMESIKYNAFDIEGWYSDLDDKSTKYEPNSAFCEDTKYYPAYSGQCGISVEAIKNNENNTYKLRIKTRVYTNKDKIKEKGTLFLPTRFLGDNSLTLETKRVARSIGKYNCKVNDEENYIDYYGTLVNIPESQKDTIIKSVSYVTYENDKGELYTVYTDNGDISVSEYLK